MAISLLIAPLMAGRNQLSCRFEVACPCACLCQTELLFEQLGYALYSDSHRYISAHRTANNFSQSAQQQYLRLVVSLRPAHRVFGLWMQCSTWSHHRPSHRQWLDPVSSTIKSKSHLLMPVCVTVTCSSSSSAVDAVVNMAHQLPLRNPLSSPVKQKSHFLAPVLCNSDLLIEQLDCGCSSSHDRITAHRTTYCWNQSLQLTQRSRIPAYLCHSRLLIKYLSCGCSGSHSHITSLRIANGLSHSVQLSNLNCIYACLCHSEMLTEQLGCGCIGSQGHTTAHRTTNAWTQSAQLSNLTRISLHNTDRKTNCRDVKFSFSLFNLPRKTCVY